VNSQYHTVSNCNHLNIQMIGVQKMDKQQGDEFVKVLQEQPIVSTFEYVETMAD